MRISDWSSDVCSSDLHIADVASEERGFRVSGAHEAQQAPCVAPYVQNARAVNFDVFGIALIKQEASHRKTARIEVVLKKCRCRPYYGRSEEHTSELKSLMRISYAVFCMKKKNTKIY